MSVEPDDEELKKQLEEREKKEAEDKAEAKAKAKAEALQKQKADVERHDKEAKLLYDYYDYDEKSIDKHAHIITIGRYKSEQDKIKSKKLSRTLKKKRNKKIEQLNKKNISKKNIRKKKIEIAELEIRILYCKSKTDDAQTHYELFDKINTKASLTPTPKTLRALKNQTTRVNNAIQQQRKLLNTLKKNALASAKAARSLSPEHLELANNLLTKSPKKAMEYLENNITGKKATAEKKAVLAYVQCERDKRDSEIDYQFSRKIFENAVRDASKEADVTKELKEQLASLAIAINEREGYKKGLVAAEAKKLENFNMLVLLETEIAKVTKNTRQLSTKKKNKKIAELEQRFEALELEDKQLNRKIDDANRLYSFSNYLIAEAIKDGDAKKLAEKLTSLKVAAKRQKIYRKKLKAVEKKILKTNAKKPKTENNKQRNELTKKQLEREKDDAELAHSMMTELIEDAENAERADNENPDTDPDKKSNLTTLKERTNQLREGIGGRGKYNKFRVFGQVKNRLALEEAENKHIEIEIKRRENKQRLDDPKFNSTKQDLNALRDVERRAGQTVESKALASSVILNRMSLHDIRELGQLSVKDATLSLQEQQASRRVANAKQDHAIGRAFLEQARLDKNFGKLQSQFELMVTTVADRNVLTRLLEEEETRQLKKKNEIKKAEFEVVEHKKKHEIEKEKLKDIASTRNTGSPEFIAQQSAVYASESQLQYKEWELKKLQRRQAENATFDKRRLENAEKNERDANTFLRIILNPNASPENIKNAKEKLAELKKKIEKEKKLEKKLAPSARVKERAQYRANLEKAEEKRLEHTKKMNALAIEELKASIIIDEVTKTATKAKLAEKRKQLEAIGKQIEREEADTKLLYDFSAKLLQLSINDTSEENTRDAAKKLKAQFKALKVVEKIQKNLRDRIKAIDKRMNSRLYLSLNIKTKAQLQRQKNDLIFGHTETQKLIQAAFDKDPPDPEGLATDCKNLREGIGGTRKYSRRSFGQERNREALDKYESLDSKNEKKLMESNIRLAAADAVKNEHPKRYKRALENYEDCQLLKEQSHRRLLDAKNDYEMGKKLLEKAVADTPLDPSKSARLALLPKQFAVLKIAITARNKLVKRLEKIEKKATETARKDAKNIKKAEDKEKSLKDDLKKAEAKLKKLKAADPQDQDLDAINRQEARIEKLQEKIANQTDKIEHLKDKENGNKIRNDGLIKSAKKSCNDANIGIQIVLGSTDEKAAKDRFTHIQDNANSADKADKRERKAQNKSYNAKIKQSRATNKKVRQTAAAARKEKLAAAKQAAANAKAAAANQGATAAGTTTTPAATTAPTATGPISKATAKIKSGANTLKSGATTATKKVKKGLKKVQEGTKELAGVAKEGAVTLAKKASDGIGVITRKAAAKAKRAKQGITKYAVKLPDAIRNRIQLRKERVAARAAAIAAATAAATNTQASAPTQTSVPPASVPRPPAPKTPAALASPPARPITLNCISAPVHASAAARAPTTLAKETNGRYIMEPKLDKGKPTKDFILFEVDPVSNKKIKVADISFKADENTQKEMMTAQFNSPIKENTISGAIKAVAGVAAQCQPNDTVLYAKEPSGITSTFSNPDHNALVTTSCKEQFGKKHEQERSPQPLTSIAKDNTTITNTAANALEQKNQQEQATQPDQGTTRKLSMH